MDISTRRLADIGTVDVRQTVRRIRTQRAFSIQMPDQYVFCHLALIEHAQREGLLNEADLAGFDDSSDESDWFYIYQQYKECYDVNIRRWTHSEDHVQRICYEARIDEWITPVIQAQGFYMLSPKEQSKNCSPQKNL